MKTLIAPIGKSLLCEEVAQLRKRHLLISRGKFEVFLAQARQIPSLLQEIARLRELTFRSVGEGTGNALDLDRFDDYYHNLFIWDKETQNIVGGYRVGAGKPIFRQYGAEGFYINSLFDIDPRFYPVLRQSVELGRSYIVPEYQRGLLPLFLLWQGILIFLIKNPHYCYLIGPVSISKYYSDVSKSLIVAFVRRYFFDHETARLIRPKTPFKPCLKQIDPEEVLNQFGGELKDLDSFLETIEPRHLKVPVLLKQYTRQNAKFIGFNIDPNFSDSLDGLMLLDLKNLPKETLSLLHKK